MSKLKKSSPAMVTPPHPTHKKTPPAISSPPKIAVGTQVAFALVGTACAEEQEPRTRPPIPTVPSAFGLRNKRAEAQKI